MHKLFLKDKKYTCFKKVDSIALELEPDPYRDLDADPDRDLDPDPNSLYLDPQHGFKLNRIIDCCDALIWGQPEDTQISV